MALEMLLLVGRDKIDSTGKITLRYLGRVRHIPVGSAHKNRRVRLLVAGPDVHVHNVLPQACTMS